MPRYVSLSQAGRYIGKVERTIRLHIAAGYYPAYKVPGRRGLVVDLDEVDTALDRLPGTKIRGAYGQYGPDADIRTLPPTVRVPVQVEPER